MENTLNFFYIMRSVLFEGLAKEDVEELLPYFNAEVKSYLKDEILGLAEQTTCRIGLILEGSVRVEHVNAWGDIAILTIMEQGKTFGEAAACSRGAELGVDYVAEQDCKILFLDAEIIMQSSGGAHSKRSVVASNLTALLARRNMELSRRAFVMTNRTTRAKMLTYLSTAAKAYGTNKFKIPYNREELARYLGVDRSALSAELSRMQRDGLIKFRKSEFELLQSDGY